MMKTLTLCLALLAAAAPAMAQDAAPKPVYGLAMHGDLKYASDFQHLDYVNPDAPKGGTLRLSALGTFDNLNSYIIKGAAGAGAGLVNETLLESTADEAFSEYGLIAESIEVPEDRSWVVFNLRQQAKWHDGVQITADDVVWSFNTLTTEGSPLYKAYYANVKAVEALSPARVKFTFDMANNRELPLIVGQLPILPKHYWTADGRKFSETTLTPPLGSGPYKYGEIIAGRTINLTRVTDWWGADLPINRGRYNFDRITYEYFRDGDVALQAFLGGQYDFRLENTAKFWATAYNSPAVTSGEIKKEEIKNELPQGMQGFIFNTRRPVFQDRAVREALSYAFDFEFSNKQFAYDSYKRSVSYFSNSEMAATMPITPAETALLDPFRDQIPAEIFTGVYAPPKTDGSGNNRANLKKAADILDAAGYKIGKDGIRSRDGVRLEFEFIDSNPAFQRWILPFTQNLQKIGVKASYRTVDASQYENRMQKFDYDMTVMVFGQSNSPGNEQREYWGSTMADAPGSRNYIGIKSPAIDALIGEIVAAPTRDDLITRVRALDRVLQWNYYLVPNWHIAAWRVAWWDKFERPAITPKYGLPVETTWWAKQ